jgi:hypothetical protein
MRQRPHRENNKSAMLHTKHLIYMQTSPRLADYESKTHCSLWARLYWRAESLKSVARRSCLRSPSLAEV